MVKKKGRYQMKKLTYPLLVLVMVFLLIACQQSTPTMIESPTSSNQNQLGSTVVFTQEPALQSSLTPIPTSTYQPTATVTRAAPTPTASPVPTMLPTPTVEVGQPITLTTLSMSDESVGWAFDTANHIVRTTDSGLTWADVTPVNLTAGYIGGFFLNAQSAWAYDYSDPLNGLAHTTDGGKTWSIVAKSFPFAAYASVTFLNDEDGWAETYEMGAGQANITLYETHDSGATWSQIMLSTPGDRLSEDLGTLHLCSICGDSFYYDPVRMMITSGDLASDPTGKVILFVSTDFGNTWQELHLNMPSSKYNDGLVNPQLPVFFNAKDGYLPFGIVKFSSQGSHVYDVLAVYATHDGGLSWILNSTVLENVKNTMLGHSVIDFVSPMDAFVACGNDLCVTQDGAQSWQKITSSLNFAYAEGIEYVEWFDFVSPAAGWAFTQDGSGYSLWGTTNGGLTWLEITPQLKNGH
jgi:photosystem II stability/assembly factor-like uncharacterized protein